MYVINVALCLGANQRPFKFSRQNKRTSKQITRYCIELIELSRVVPNTSNYPTLLHNFIVILLM